MKEQKKLLGSPYQYRQWLNEEEIAALSRQKGEPLWCTAASLTIGCVRLDAVVFPEKDGLQWGYDLLVREDISSEDWVCYDSLTDSAGPDEEQMLSILERAVEASGLSYTNPAFPQTHPKKHTAGFKMEM